MRAVIWGLKSSHHTHRYIHSAFSQAFSLMGWETLWVDDSPTNVHAVQADSVVLALGGQAKFLPTAIDARYILHNYGEGNDPKTPKRFLRLQVFTKDYSGERLSADTLAFYDASKQTLFQPWGWPEENLPMLGYNSNPGRVEFWVGSIWNNSLNQGNTNEISKYREALAKQNLKFAQVGSETTLSKALSALHLGDFARLFSSVNETKARMLVNMSPIGATIVGEWQKQAGYIPCRLFKNLAAGQPVYSNSDFSHLMGDLSFRFNDPFELIENRLAKSKSIARKTVSESQDILSKYSYRAAISRILSVMP